MALCYLGAFVGFCCCHFQCGNFDLSQFLTLSQNIQNARDVHLRIMLSMFCHLALGWVLLRGFKCFTSAVPQHRKTEPCLEYKVRLWSEKWLCENGMFLVNRSVPYVYYHFHMHVSLVRVSLSLLFNLFASGAPAGLWRANYILSCLSRHKWSCWWNPSCKIFVTCSGDGVWASPTSRDVADSVILVNLASVSILPSLRLKRNKPKQTQAQNQAHVPSSWLQTE